MRFDCLRVSALAVVSVSALLANAQTLDGFTLTDGNSSYSEGNLRSQRLTDLGGRPGAFSTGGIESPMQNWWWYRAGLDNREFALSNQVSGVQSTPSFVQLDYDEMVTGFTGPALRFTLRYELTELEPGHARCFIGFGVQNLTSATIPVNLFSYLDVDLAGTVGNDRAMIGGSNREIQTIQDDAIPVTMTYGASTRNIYKYEIGGFPSLRNKLSDGSADDLSDSTAIFGPGDYTGGFEWRTDLGPQDSVFVGAITKEIQVVPEPSALIAFGAGFGILAIRRRRR